VTLTHSTAEQKPWERRGVRSKHQTHNYDVCRNDSSGRNASRRATACLSDFIASTRFIKAGWIA